MINSKAKAKRKSRRKIDEATGDGGDEPSASMSKSPPLKYGYVSLVGRQRVMEDPVMVVPPLKLPGGYSFFAAYGGRRRAKVGEACVDKLHRCLEKHTAEAKEEELGWGKVMMECLGNMFEESAPGRMMFTAVVVGVEKGEVVLVNCGGSRAVLWSGGVASPLWNECELDESIEAKGGSRNDGVVSAAKIKVAEARSENDAAAGDEEAGRRSEVEVRVRRRNDESGDEFVIIATDGLWNVVGKETACEIVRKCVGGKTGRSPPEGGGAASHAAALLAELAIAKGSKDNISIIVVHLN